MKKQKSKKTVSKTSGLKEALSVQGTVIMTSFGKGNMANLSYKIPSSQKPQNLNSSAGLKNVEVSGKKIKFQGRHPKIATTDNPLFKPQPGMDLLCLKDKLEMHYFGKTFDDNIHIQLIYQILDIEKILAVHVNNIVFTLDNVLHPQKEELTEDFIGAGGWRINLDYQTLRGQTNKYDRFKNYIKRKELLYFGEAFYHENERRYEEDIFAILTLLSALRQFCFHSDLSSDESDHVNSFWLYQLEDQLSDEFKETLSILWEEVTERIDSEFLKTNTVNLHILCHVFPKESKETIVRAYYEFLIKKSFKNMGFSIKKLREIMLEQSDLKSFKEDKYNSVRAKLYKLFDFIITYYYDHHAFEKEALVSSLRSSLTEENKEEIYIKTARTLASALGADFKKAAADVNAKNIRDYQKKANDYRISFEDIKIGNTGIGYFSELIYMLTLLLDGKEINDLLTTLINKFDNIISFIDILKKLNLEFKFKPEYADFFNMTNCRYTLEELRVINSIARMQKPSADARKIMYRDALRILGMDNRPDEEIDRELERTMPVGADGKFIKGKQGFRNFIASNVIESSRFHYLVRYNNPHKTRTLVKNPNVVKFVLEGIPETQIKRYFDVCKGQEIPPTSDKSAQIDVLARIISSVDYKIFEDVPQSAKINKDDPSRNFSDALKKQRYQAIVSLYLTVMYLITKNLVYVNSRYVIAFHCLERDAFLHGVTLPKMNKKIVYSQLTTHLLTDKNYTTYGHLKNQKGHRKWYVLVKNNLQNSDITAVSSFRNIVAHISVVRNSNEYISGIGELHSYFELYHYLVQSMIAKNNWYDTSHQPKTAEYLNNLKKHHTYCKDFVKAYCIPFGYVVPRYKNLTINELFDRNNPNPEPKEEV